MNGINSLNDLISTNNDLESALDNKYINHNTLL